MEAQQNKLTITTMSVVHSLDLQQAQRLNGMPARQKVFRASHLKNLASLFALRMLHILNPCLSKDASIFCIYIYMFACAQGSAQALEKPGFSAQPLHPSQLSCTNTRLDLEKSLAPLLHWFLQAPHCTGDSKAKANTSQTITPGRENGFPKPPSAAWGKGENGKAV